MNNCYKVELTQRYSGTTETWRVYSSEEVSEIIRAPSNNHKIIRVIGSSGESLDLNLFI